MTKTREIYRCSICGNIVEVLHEGAVLSCCGKPMELLKGNSTDGAYEKHVPVVEKVEGGFKVKVGAVEHPMTEEHYIQWVYVETENGGQRRAFRPGDTPEATFCTGEDKPVAVYAYCNLHGLWKTEI